jgi:uncharacterized protein YjiS (DUF1127 family)
MTTEAFKGNLSLPTLLQRLPFGQGLTGLARRLRHWRDRNAALRELSHLDDRTLRDIGIEPYELRGLIDAQLADRDMRQHRLNGL